MKRIAMTLLVLLLASVLIVALVACDKEETSAPEGSSDSTSAPAGSNGTAEDTRTPEELLNDALNKLGNGNDDLARLMTALESKGTVELSINPVLPAEMSSVGTLGGKITAIRDGAKGYLNMAFTMGENSSHISCITDGASIAFSSSVWNETYGMTTAELAAEISEMLKQIVAEIGGSEGELPLPSENAVLSAETLRAIVEVFRKNVTLTKTVAEDQTVRLSVRIDTPVIKTIVTELGDLAKKDESIRAMLADIFGEEATLEEILAGALKQIDEDPLTVTGEIVIGENDAIRSASMTVVAAEESNTTSISLVIPQDGGFVLEIKAPDDMNVTIEKRVTVSGDDRKTQYALGGTSFGGVTLTPVTLNYNTKTGAYSLVVAIPGQFSASLTGKYTCTSTSMEFTADTLKVTVSESPLEEGETVELRLGLSLKVTTEATVPAVPAFTPINSLSDDEKQAILSAIAEDEVFGSLMEAIGAIGGGSQPGNGEPFGSYVNVTDSEGILMIQMNDGLFVGVFGDDVAIGNYVMDAHNYVYLSVTDVPETERDPETVKNEVENLKVFYVPEENKLVVVSNDKTIDLNYTDMELSAPGT